MHRRMHRIKRQVEQERIALMPFDERDRLPCERIGQVFPFLDHLAAAIDGRYGRAGRRGRLQTRENNIRQTRLVNMSSPQESEEFVKATFWRLEFRGDS